MVKFEISVTMDLQSYSVIFNYYKLEMRVNDWKSIFYAHVRVLSYSQMYNNFVS